MFRPESEPNRPVNPERLRRLLDQFEIISDLTMPGLILADERLEGHTFFGCNFANMRLRGGQIRNAEFELCFFPFSMFNDVVFSGLTMRSCVFGGSLISSCRFEGSLVVQCNFNGVEASRLVFDDCDLLHTRFATASFRSVQFENCNLKETRFLGTDVGDTVFHYSNQEDAVFTGGEWS